MAALLGEAGVVDDEDRVRPAHETVSDAGVFPGFDDKIVSMYARGMSTREIAGHLRELYGIEVSPDLISAVSLVPLVEEQASASVACQRRNNAVSIRTTPSRSANRVLASLSLLTWEHVNLTGDYLWEDKPAIDENGFRAIPFAL